MMQIEEKIQEEPIEPDKVDTKAKRKKATREIDQIAKRKGVIWVTTDKFKGVIESGHAAIVYGSGYVVEALSGGVACKGDNWNKSKNEFYACTVNTTTIAEDVKAANYCHRRVGKAYNWNYFDINTRKKFYCSHLVYSAFKDLFSINLNTNLFKTPFGNPIHPYELLSTDKTTVIARYK